MTSWRICATTGSTRRHRRKGTLIFPMTGGGVNWGSAAFDPVHQILYANTSYAIHIVKLMPSSEVEGYTPPPGHDFGRQRGAPFAMTRVVAMSKLGLLCNKPPWGAMVAVDLKAGKILWRSTVGTSEDLAPLGLAFPWGTPLVNGVAITAGGLVFTGAMDAYLRAFDAKSGAELWQGRLPVPGVANPMTYLWKGEQYVAIAAGGHSEAGTSIGDSVVAFRLARRGRSRRRCGRAPSTGPADVLQAARSRQSWCWRDRDRAVALAAATQAKRCGLVEGDADPPVVAPHRMTAAREAITVDHQHEGRRQAERVGHFETRAGFGQIAHGAQRCPRRRTRCARPSALSVAVIGVSRP